MPPERPADALCRLDDLADPGSVGIAADRSPLGVGLLVVRWRGIVRAYVNSCPHTGVALDWVPGQFLDADDEHVQCATHGALFRVVDGRCVAGPCAGDALEPVPVEVIDGWVSVAQW